MLDVVKTTFQQDGKTVTRYYDNSFDIGLGGLVCKYVNRSGKRWGSNFTYFSTIVKSFLLFKSIPVELKSEHFNFKGKGGSPMDIGEPLPTKPDLWFDNYDRSRFS